MRNKTLLRLGASFAALGAMLVFSLAVPRRAWAQSSSMPQYHLVKKVVLGGEGGWDYISADPVSHHVFTSNGGGGSVTIFDPDTLKVISEVKIPGRNKDGILYDPASKRVFTFNEDTKVRR